MPRPAEIGIVRRAESLAPPVVVTGVGLVTSLGWSFEETFANLCEGRFGVRRIESSPNSGDHIQEPIVGFPLSAPASVRDTVWDDPVFWVLKAASEEAVANSGIDLRTIDPARIAIVVGLSKGAVVLQTRWADDPAAMSASPLARHLGWSGVSPSAGAAFLSSHFGSKGPLLSPITACATGLTAVRVASELLADDKCDVVLAGAADASLTPMITSAFRRMKALATPKFTDEPPENWTRPWSADRNGFLIGEGGAIFVLERASDIKSSGRRPIAGIKAYSSGCEAHHATRPEKSSATLSRVISDTLGTADASPLPDAIHLHATATREFDPLEAGAIRKCLRTSADHPRILASKAQIGHCLGAAGAVELAICCGIIARDILPPFAPAAPYDFATVGRPVGPRSIRETVGSLLKIVAGFGGHIEAMLVTKPDDAPGHVD